nr:retrovirus-related Pol polyprotein from transposon TNT 1-94 [Tanacetum cinerariifolium]
MANLSEDIQCAASNTRPPMLDRTDFASWQQRIRLYCRGKENGVNILKSYDERPFQMGTFRETLSEGNEGALHLGPERPRVYFDLSLEEKERYNAGIRATNILLQRLLKDIYTFINHYTDAKDILDNVKMLLEGSKITKEDCESQLYDDFKHFRQHKRETIHDYYVRFAKLINDMQNIKMTMSRMQLNSKFVNNMLPEWGRFITAVKLNKRLRDSNYDQLVVIQNVQGRQNRGQGNNVRGAGAAGYEGAQNRVGNANSEYFKDKMLLMQAHENGVALDEEKLLFIAGGQDNAVDEDVDGQSVQDLLLNVDNVFKADNCDAFDYDVDEAPTAQTMFMANLSSADPVYNEVGPSYDLDFLSEPALYNGHEILKTNHVSAIVHNSEETQKIAEITRKKMNDKMKDPKCVKKKVKIAPHDYSKENYLATFTPQKQLTPEQIFWSKDLLKMKEEALKEQTTASRPIKALTVYPPNTSATLFPGIQNDDHDVMIKHFSKLELEHLILQLKYQHLKESFENKKPVTSSDAPTFDLVFVIGKLKDHVQSRGNTIRELREKISQLTKKHSDADPIHDLKALDSQNKELHTKVNALHNLNKRRRAKNEKVERATAASGSKPRSNTKKDRTLPAKSDVQKVEVHPRNNKSSVKQKNHVDSSISYKRTVVNSNSNSICKTCNKCLMSVNHDNCVVKSVKSVKQPPVKKVWQIKQVKQVWQATRKLFATVGSRGSNLYTILVEDMMKSSPICLLSKASKNKSWLWHRRLNHLNFGTINDLARKDLVRGLPRLKFEKDHLCSACQLGKSKKHTHKLKDENTNLEVLHTLHMDLCGPMRVQTINGNKYILVIVDDYTKFTWVKFLRSKVETPEFVIKFLKQIQVGLNNTVRFIRTDNGTKFINHDLTQYYESVGIFHQKSILRTLQQNSIIERRNCTLVEASRTMLIFSKALMFLWTKAIATACYTKNRSLIHTRHNKTPYELVHDKKPGLTFLRVFGALCYPTNDSEDLGKLQPTADIGIFIGYAPTRKVPATPYVPPTNKDLEILFQPMFYKYLEPSHVERPVSPAPAVPVPVNTAGTPASTTIDQDAPSPSHLPSSSALQSPSLQQSVAVESTIMGYNPLAPVDNDPFANVFAPEPSSEASSSGDVSSAASTYITQTYYHL